MVRRRGPEASTAFGLLCSCGTFLGDVEMLGVIEKLVDGRPELMADRTSLLIT